MNILLSIAFWLILTIYGALLIKPLTNNLTKLEIASLGLLIGAGLHAILYFIVLKFSNNVFPSYYLFPLELTISFLASLLPGIKSNQVPFYIKKENMIISLTGVIVGTMILSYTFVQATFWPVYEPDAIHLYDYRARRLLLNDRTVMFGPLPYEHNSQYPPFTSLFHLFSYQNGLTNPKVLYPILYIAWYLSLLGYLLRTTKSPILSIWGANIIIASPNIWWQSFQAMTNVPYMIYLTLGLIYLAENSRIAKILISSFLVSISLFIRSEPFWMIPALVIIINLYVNKKNKSAIWFITPILVYSLLVTTNNDSLKNTDQIVSIVSPFIYPSNGNYYLSAIWNGFNQTIIPIAHPLLLMLVTFFTLSRMQDTSKAKPYYWSALLAVAVFMLGVVNYSLRYPSSEINNDSINRMSIIMLPSIFLSTIINIKQLRDLV